MCRAKGLLEKRFGVVVPLGFNETCFGFCVFAQQVARETLWETLAANSNALGQTKKCLVQWRPSTKQELYRMFETILLAIFESYRKGLHAGGADVRAEWHWAELHLVFTAASHWLSSASIKRLGFAKPRTTKWNLRAGCFTKTKSLSSLALRD